MDETLVQTTTIAKSSPNKARWLFAVLAFGLLWFELINQLKGEWWLNPQYNYGLIVPFLVVYLLWKRWPIKPGPSRPTTNAMPMFLIVICAALFLPIRFLAEANPDWRLLNWLLALVVVSISLAFVYLNSGVAWLRHFAFPFLFFLIAVPWPVRIEQVVIQDLMRAVTALNVIFLQLAGVPALRHGNVIEVGSGLIGVEEACSGVRSLQATLMISLFLGELYSFTIARRVFLVIAGGLLAFLCNVGRTALLVWMGAKNGAKSIEAWHDPAGLTILLVCLLGLWLLSLKMRRGANVGNSASGSVEPTLRPVCPTASARRATARRGRKRARRESCATSWPLLASLTLWFLLAEAGVQSW